MLRGYRMHRSIWCSLSLLMGMGASLAQGRVGAKLPLDDFERLARAMTIIKTDAVVAPDQRKLVDACIKGMVVSLDGESSYLDRESMDNLRQGSLPVAGIGVELALRGGFPMVVAPLADSPAERAGLKPGDVIIDVNGESTEDQPLDEIVLRLRGEVGSNTSVIVRGEVGQPNRRVSLTRARIQPLLAQARFVAPGVAFLKVRQFLESTPSVVVAELDKLRQKADIKGLVLDLRNSPGGLLSASLELAAMMLPEDAVIASTNGQLAEAQRTYRANPYDIERLDRVVPPAWPGYLHEVPVVVLVNRGTASGAEIVAAALRDHHRARLVGSKTFGRGSIQTIRILGPDTAIKLTTATVLTPSGQSFHRKGLEPDVPVADIQNALEVGTPADKAMLKALDMLAGKV